MNTIGKINDFFNNYLCFERGVSDRTLRSYATTLLLLITFIRRNKKIGADKVKLEMINQQNVLTFLRHLQENKNLSISTCNQRLAAIKSFAKYMLSEDIIHCKQWNDILKISKKKGPKYIPEYLSIEAMALLFKTIPQSTRKGRRDLALLSIMYETGGRSQEIIDVTPSSLHLSSAPYQVKLHGKGNKSRLCTISEVSRNTILQYMEENNLNTAQHSLRPLFFNQRGTPLTNSGIAYILSSYVDEARKENPNIIPNHITPHTLRHTRAMHLLAKGMNLIYIRDILGHVSIQTTELYLRIDSKSKQEALQKAHTPIIPSLSKEMDNEDEQITRLLKSIGK